MKQVILASGSPRRKELLGKAGLEFTVDPSSYEEELDSSLEPSELVKQLSLGKAQDVAKRHKDAVIIGADTVITFEGKILGKPRDEEDAKETLSRLSGEPHSVITGFTIIDTDTGKTLSKSVETKIYFKNLTAEEIGDYVNSGEPLGKAGSYAIQGLGKKLVEKIEGDFDNVVGLPVNEVVNSLREFNL